jgi:predicted transcriptional regulator
MGKKQTQFRFEEDFISDLSQLAEEQGITMSELVRNALRLYIALYGRMKGKTYRLFLEVEEDGKDRCEVILPWLP